MSKVRNVALTAALGFAMSAPLYAGDTYHADTPQNSQGTQSAAWSGEDVRAALSTCDSWTGTEQAKCVVNLRPNSRDGPGRIDVSLSSPWAHLSGGKYSERWNPSGRSRIRGDGKRMRSGEGR